MTHKSFRHLMESDEEDYDYDYDDDDEVDSINDNDDNDNGNGNDTSRDNSVAAATAEDDEETSLSADSQSGEATPAAAIASIEATVGDSDWEVLSHEDDGDWVDVTRRSRSNSAVSDISSSWVRCGEFEDGGSEVGAHVKPTMAQLLQPSQTGSRGALPRPHGICSIPPLSRKPALKSISESARGEENCEDDFDPLEFMDARGHHSRKAGKLPRSTKLMNRVNDSKQKRQWQRNAACGGDA